jgi:hypothetical protein
MPEYEFLESNLSEESTPWRLLDYEDEDGVAHVTCAVGSDEDTANELWLQAEKAVTRMAGVYTGVVRSGHPRPAVLDVTLFQGERGESDSEGINWRIEEEWVRKSGTPEDTLRRIVNQNEELHEV